MLWNLNTSLQADFTCFLVASYQKWCLFFDTQYKVSIYLVLIIYVEDEYLKYDKRGGRKILEKHSNCRVCSYTLKFTHWTIYDTVNSSLNWSPFWKWPWYEINACQFGSSCIPIEMHSILLHTTACTGVYVCITPFFVILSKLTQL